MWYGIGALPWPSKRLTKLVHFFHGSVFTVVMAVSGAIWSEYLPDGTIQRHLVQP